MSQSYKDKYRLQIPNPIIHCIYIMYNVEFAPKKTNKEMHLCLRLSFLFCLHKFLLYSFNLHCKQPMETGKG